MNAEPQPPVLAEETGPAALPDRSGLEDPDALRARGGLTGAEAERLRAEGKANIAPTDSSRSLWSILRANVFTLFNAIVCGGFLLLLLVGQWKDALFGFSAVMNAIIGVVQEWRAKKSLDELALLNAPRALVVREGERCDIAREEVVLGDLMVVTAGDQIPADAEVLEATGLAVDESLLTGESEPVDKAVGTELLAGSAVVAGHGLARVDRVGADSFAAKLTVEAKRFSLVDSEIRNGLNRILRWITWLLAPVMLLVVNAQMQTFGGWEAAIQTGAWRQACVGAIGAAIAMVPLGLVLMTSVAFAVGAVKLARQQVLVQELPAVEGLARVDVICFDKTGTLTDGTFEFDSATTPEGAGEPEHGWREAVAAMSVDEHANASAQALATGFADVEPARSSRQIVFSSARKWSAMAFEEGPRGTWVLGAPDIVVREGTPEADRFLAETRRLSAEGRRTMLLAYARTPLDEAAAAAEQLPEHLEPQAIICLRERLRDDAAETVEYFREQGVGMRVISGDDPRTVSAVAAAAGISTSGGYDARSLPEDPEELAATMDKHIVFGRVTPEQKRRMVHALQSRGHVVAMTGDGVNDVLALKDADLGIAMGNGAAATRAVSRIVLLDAKFSHLPHVVKEGRQVIANVERVSMLFLSKTAYSILIAIAFGCLVWGFPFLPRQLSALDGLTIGLPGFILALIPNSRRYVPGFLKRALTFALPAGAIVALGILAMNILARVQGLDLDAARTASCIVLGLAALWVLNVLTRPLDVWRVLLLVACHVGMFLVMTAPIVSEFFAFTVPWGPVLWQAIGIGAVCALALEIHFRIHRRNHPGGHESMHAREGVHVPGRR
ncbi:putative cation-transporting ATPase E [Pseudoclavibacter triregionum]|nr:putative cation-transporting ATPase E [Pseudoclavibacter triregionum]